MKKYLNDIGDDEIRIIGQEGTKKPKRCVLWIVVIGVVLLVIVGIGLFFVLRGSAVDDMPAQGYFEPMLETTRNSQTSIGTKVDSATKGFVEIEDITINDIPMKIYIPHNAQMSLYVGRLDTNDTTIVYAAQAADLRQDNHDIVGAFVVKGTPLSWGLSKKGFCACIDGKVTIGVSENSPLFEEATEKGGFFFRQYPLVSNGKIVENEPKGKSIRRAICDRYGEVFMVETETPESFHDFSQALVDLGVVQAVYLVGSTFPYGWAEDKDGKRHEFGNMSYYKNRNDIPKNINYVVWRRR